jgi:hypothetical protein
MDKLLLKFINAADREWIYASLGLPSGKKIP